MGQGKKESLVQAMTHPDLTSRMMGLFPPLQKLLLGDTLSCQSSGIALAEERGASS